MQGLELSLWLFENRETLEQLAGPSMRQALYHIGVYRLAFSGLCKQSPPYIDAKPYSGSGQLHMKDTVGRLPTRQFPTKVPQSSPQAWCLGAFCL